MSNQSKSVQQIQMQLEQQRPKRFRRSRKDCDQRTFICQNCHKSYLSNAALYTHVKNKHPDELPRNQKIGGVRSSEAIKIDVEEDNNGNNHKNQKNQKNAESKESKEMGDEGDGEVLQSAQISNNFEIKESKYISLGAYNYCESLQSLRQFMKKYYPQRNKNCTIRLICQGLIPQILQYIQPILRDSTQIKLSQVNKSSLTINQIIGIFLLSMNTRVSSTCINFLIRFFFYFHYALVQETKKNDFCNKDNGYNLPNLFNLVVLHQRIPTPGFDEDQIMHNPMIVCKVLHYFGNWLYEECYTDYQLIQNYKDDC